MWFGWLAWVCVSSIWRSLDTPKSSLPFPVSVPNLIFLVCATRGHPHTLSLHAIPTTRAGHWSRAEEDTGVFQPLSACLFGHRRIQGCSVLMEKCFSPQTRLKWLQGQGSNSSCWGGSTAHFWTSGVFDPAPFLPWFFLSLAASVSVLSSDENTWGHWGMAASPTCTPDRLFSYALWLAEGAMISGKRTREAWWTAGVPLCRETASPLWPILPLSN